MPTESVRTKNQMLIRLLKIPVIHGTVKICFRSGPFSKRWFKNAPIFNSTILVRQIFEMKYSIRVYIYIYLWPISYRFTLLD